MKILTHFMARVPAGIRAKRALLAKAAATALKKFKAHGLEVNLVLVDDKEIRKINRSFLNRSCSTDVIAFNYHPEKSLRGIKGPKPFGDIYVCVPRAREQAAEMGHSLLTELLILSVHGALHLAGMEDGAPAKRKTMNAKTARILKHL